MKKIAVIILNWNNKKDSLSCIEALRKQTLEHHIIVVDNGSQDNFVDEVSKKYKGLTLLANNKNLGFSGGVNTGIRYALGQDFEYIALINNDAMPEKNWLEEILKPMKNKKVGICTGKLLKIDGKIDSTGELYTSWNLPYPRGRDELDTGQYNHSEEIFAASGGASLFRVSMLKEIGLFDKDYFAYYEDVDLCFRAQLAGWSVYYTPLAIAHHKVGASSSQIPGFTTYMTIKNLPWLFWKNVPWKLIPTILPRFTIAYISIVFSSLTKGKLVAVIKGLSMTTILLPKKLLERHKIQSSRTTGVDYIKSIIAYDLPPNAKRLKKLRSFIRIFIFWR